MFTDRDKLDNAGPAQDSQYDEALVANLAASVAEEFAAQYSANRHVEAMNRWNQPSPPSAPQVSPATSSPSPKSHTSASPTGDATPAVTPFAHRLPRQLVFQPFVARTQQSNVNSVFGMWQGPQVAIPAVYVPSTAAPASPAPSDKEADQQPSKSP